MVGGLEDRSIQARRRGAHRRRSSRGAPAEAAQLWASINRRLMDQALAAPIDGQGIDVVADHVGNCQHHPL